MTHPYVDAGQWVTEPEDEPALSASPAPAGDLVERASLIAAALEATGTANIFDGEEIVDEPDCYILDGPVNLGRVVDAVIAAMQPGWRDMESAPKDGTDILIHDDGAITVVFWDGDCWRHPYKGGKTRWDHPTAWQPLPATPGVGG